MASVGPLTVEIVHDNRVAARHTRCYGRGHQILDLEHQILFLRSPCCAGQWVRPRSQWRGVVLCKLRCLCIWSVQIATRATLSEADLTGIFLLHSLSQEQLRFEGIVELARWCAGNALGKAATPMEKGEPTPRLLGRNSPGKKLPQAATDTTQQAEKAYSALERRRDG